MVPFLQQFETFFLAIRNLLHTMAYKYMAFFFRIFDRGNRLEGQHPHKPDRGRPEGQGLERHSFLHPRTNSRWYQVLFDLRWYQVLYDHLMWLFCAYDVAYIVHNMVHKASKNDETCWIEMAQGWVWYACIKLKPVLIHSLMMYRSSFSLM